LWTPDQGDPVATEPAGDKGKSKLWVPD